MFYPSFGVVKHRENKASKIPRNTPKSVLPPQKCFTPQLPKTKGVPYFSGHPLIFIVIRLGLWCEVEGHLWWWGIRRIGNMERVKHLLLF